MPLGVPLAAFSGEWRLGGVRGVLGWGERERDWACGAGERRSGGVRGVFSGFGLGCFLGVETTPETGGKGLKGSPDEELFELLHLALPPRPCFNSIE
jgi:hypothetical protein